VVSVGHSILVFAIGFGIGYLYSYADSERRRMERLHDAGETGFGTTPPKKGRDK
jgi:hypothetical protein